MSIKELYEIYREHPAVQTDTRKLEKGDMFFALKGPSFNGNAFAEAALKAGASYAVVDETPPHANSRIIVVEDVLSTLQALALYHRQQFNIPFIAITGSNGKTTTKELVHTVLASTYKTYTTQGNLNNHIGIPLTILRVRKDAEMAIIEMGANHMKEIEGYCRYTQPTHGIITNCGKAHLEGFGSEENIRKAKGELYDYLRTHNGTAFVMWDYDYLREMSHDISTVITYGTQDADYTGLALQQSAFLTVEMTKGAHIPLVHTQLVGAYNLPNVLAAVTVGRYFNVSEEAVKSSIENYAPGNSRSQLVEKEGNHIILDAYNANPSSMKVAIENLASINAPEKVLILGAMAELGSDSLQEHQAIVDLIQQYQWKEVALVGGDFQKLSHPYQKLANAVDAAEWFKQQHFNKAHILIKGSRSMQMEKVLG